MSSTTIQWLSLVAAILLQSINGTNSNFPAYSSKLKHLLSLSQAQLNDLVVAKDAGKFFVAGYCWAIHCFHRLKPRDLHHHVSLVAAPFVRGRQSVNHGIHQDHGENRLEAVEENIPHDDDVISLGNDELCAGDAAIIMPPEIMERID
ncbi:hypothetical protein Dimus_003227 [Dionaea muscipula]